MRRTIADDAFLEGRAIGLALDGIEPVPGLARCNFHHRFEIERGRGEIVTHTTSRDAGITGRRYRLGDGGVGPVDEFDARRIRGFTPRRRRIQKSGEEPRRKATNYS